MGTSEIVCSRKGPGKPGLLLVALTKNGTDRMIGAIKVLKNISQCNGSRCSNASR